MERAAMERAGMHSRPQRPSRPHRRSCACRPRRPSLGAWASCPLEHAGGPSVYMRANDVPAPCASAPAGSRRASVHMRANDDFIFCRRVTAHPHRLSVAAKSLDSRFRGNDWGVARCALPVIPAEARMMPSTPPRLRQLPSFPRRRESIGVCDARMPEHQTRPLPAPPAVIPAKAGIHRCLRRTHAGAPDTSIAGAPCRHSREGGNPSVFVTHACRSTRHVHCRRPLPSFPRRRESIGVCDARMPEHQTRPLPAPPAVIPAQAGIHRLSLSAYVRASDASSPSYLPSFPRSLSPRKRGAGSGNPWA